MRFVPIKTDDQLDMQSLHRVRERWVVRRTAVVNQVHGLLLERREERLRKARDWFFQNYWPETFEESMRIAAPRTEGGTNFHDGSQLLGAGLRPARL